MTPPSHRLARVPALPPVGALSCSRRGWGRLVLAAAVAGAGIGGGPGRALAATLPGSTALAQDLALALQAGQPLVVMVSLPGCPFCKTVRDSYLAPLHTQDRLPVVQVDMRSTKTLTDFAGQLQTQDQLIQAWRIKIAPTVLFFGREGQEVAKRLSGAYLPDFYGAYLDERLAQARQALRT